MKHHHFPPDPIFRGMWTRLLQFIAFFGPGQSTLRVMLHRWRGVQIGKPVSIGMGVLIETAFPQWVSIGNNVIIGMRSTLIGHFDLNPPSEAVHAHYISVRIEDDVFLGPGCIILPGVTVGRGAVVTAGSVVTQTIPPLTMVQGNPARAIARCGIPLTFDTTLREFLARIKPIRPAAAGSALAAEISSIEAEK